MAAREVLVISSLTPSPSLSHSLIRKILVGFESGPHPSIIESTLWGWIMLSSSLLLLAPCWPANPLTQGLFTGGRPHCFDGQVLPEG